MALWATYHSGSDLVLHAAGWLEGGLTASFEKFVLDVEVLKMFDRLREGIVVDAEHLALRRDPRRGAGRHVPGVAAHARALPRVAHHLAAVPLAGPSDVGQAGRADGRPGRGAGVEEAARELRGSRASTTRSTRSCRSSWRAARRCSTRERPAPRHPLRARPDRAGDAAEPLLPGAALHRVRRHEAVHAGRAPRHEGRRRLGRGVHGVLLDLPHLRRRAVRLLAPVGRRGRGVAAADDRGRARARRAGRGRAVARRRDGDGAREPAADRWRRARSRTSTCRGTCRRR